MQSAEVRCQLARENFGGGSASSSCKASETRCTLPSGTTAAGVLLNQLEEKPSG